MNPNGPEKVYQLETKEGQILNANEQKTLSDINNFLKQKNYTEGKTALDKKDDPALKNIQEKYGKIKDKVKEKQSTVKSTIDKTQSVNVDRPAPGIVVTTEKMDKSSEDELENVGQTKGKVEYLDKEQLDSIVSKIKDNMNEPSFSLSIVGRSDANKFIEGPTARTLKQTYNSLVKDMRKDLPEKAKESFTAPSRPANGTEQEISDWLNVILAQTRALQALQGIKKTIGAQDFKKIMDKENTAFSVQAHMPTVEGEDRGVGVICKNKINKEGTGITTPKLTETKETIKEKEHFEFYQSVKFTTVDGKTFYKMFKRAMMIENKTGVPSKLVPKGWTTVSSQRNSEKKTIPSNQATAAAAIKYPDKYGAPDMDKVASQDATQKSAVLEKTITTNTDGSVSTSEEYTTAAPSKVILPELVYNLTKEEAANNIYDKTESTIIPYLEKKYPITTTDDVRRLAGQKPSF